MRTKPVADLWRLPAYEIGTAATTWWGTLAFISLEATGFGLAAGMYLFLESISTEWPTKAPLPDPTAGTIVTLLLLASAIPNHLASRWARAEDLRKVRIGMVIMSLFGILPLAVRWFEFPLLNVRWDTNAYGSILWFILGLHTTHLLTDVGDTLVLAVLMFTRHGNRGRRFDDVSDNAFYWYFVIVSWLPIYALIYWVPRL